MTARPAPASALVPGCPSTADGPRSQPIDEGAAGARSGVDTARLRAWAVHALTMSGLVWACLAGVALIEGRIAWMWLWLGIAMIVDGVDGTLARRARVKEVVPWFDGCVLDNIVDYLTWTFIPAVFMFLHLPLGPRPLALAMMIVATVSSVFCYANEGEKSADSYFVGFPAAWNLVAVAMYVLGTPAPVNVAVTLVLAGLTLAPLHFTHPMRVQRLRAANIIASIVWIAATGVLVALHPARPAWALWAFGVSAVWFLLTGLARTLRGRQDA